MKNEYFFNSYERILLARYYKEIKLNCYDAYKKLSKHEKLSITGYRSQFNNPENYANSQYKNVFLPESELIKMCDIAKIKYFFLGDYITYNKHRCYTSTVKISYDSLQKIIAIIHAIPELDTKTAKYIELASLIHDRFAFVFDNMQIIFETESDASM